MRVPLTLVLGGARSGKSAFAERLVEGVARPIYLATAEARDAEMDARIRHHRAQRGDRWTTVEEPLRVDDALRRHARADTVVVVDCLTLWLNNLMQAERDVWSEIETLTDSLASLAGPVIMVSNEVGAGVVPEYHAARLFRDYAGRLHQSVAGRAQQVFLLVAGIPMVVKDDAAGRP